MWSNVRAELFCGSRRIDPLFLEASADAAHAHAGRPEGREWTPSFDALVARHGLVLEYDHGFPEGEMGLVLGSKIILATGMREPRRVAVGSHEFCHWKEGDARWDAAHADIWAMTLMLAWPLSAMRAGAGPVFPFPAELVVLRAQMPTAARVLRKQGRLDDFV